MLRPRKRRLERALTIGGSPTSRAAAYARAAFDYTDGGADAEGFLARAHAAFADVTFHPRALAVVCTAPGIVMRDVSRADTSVTVLG